MCILQGYYIYLEVLTENDSRKPEKIGQGMERYEGMRRSVHLHPGVHLGRHLEVHLGMYLKVHLEVRPGVHPGAHLKVHLEVHLRMHPRVHLKGVSRPGGVPRLVCSGIWATPSTRSPPQR